MAEQTIAEKTEQFRDVGKELFAGFLEGLLKSDAAKFVSATTTDATVVTLKTLYTLLAPIGIGLGRGMAESENAIAPAFATMAADAVSALFGTAVSPDTFSDTRNRGARTNAANALGRGFIDQIKGSASTLAPSDEAAAKYLTIVTQMAMEDWFKGWFFEVLSSLVPQLDIGKIESYGELGDQIAQVLGLGRLSRRVLGPIVDTTIVTPLEWHVNRTYRPKLLGSGEVARQVARGRWTREQGIEELARQGFSNDRIEAILNAQRKYFSASDVRQFVTRDYWTKDQGLQHLKDQGFEHQAAEDALRLEGLRRIEQLEAAEASAIISAYANWEIDDSAFNRMMAASVGNATERTLLTELGNVRRELGRPRLPVSQIEQMVKSGVLNVTDYRRALRDRGYREDDVLALELQLRGELDATRRAQELREEAEAARVLEREEKAAAAIARKAEIDAERARQRRGPIGKLERAAVRGIIPIDRYAEVLRDEYDADTVALLVGLVETDRQAYLTQQERAADAEQRVRQRGLNISELQTAVLQNVITVADFRGRLDPLGLTGGDADILAATIAARKADQDAAEALRGQAAGKAEKRSIDLGRFEQLVRAGARTVTQYGALLADLGFDEPDQIDMIDLLQLKIAEDAAARDTRAHTADALDQRGLSLDQFERAVVLGVKTLDEYARFLLEQDFTTDAQIALTALLRNRVQEAEAARARREAPTPLGGRRGLPIATVRRAARLGVISPTVYADRLARDGYSLDDIDIDLELLLQEIADVQANRDSRGDQAPAPTSRQLTLAQVERAVKRGRASLDDYRAQAATLGYSADDAALLASLLADELVEQQDARDRHDEIAGELETRDLSLAQLEEAVTKGFKSLDDFYADIVGLGYAAEDAELLVNLLAVDLETAAAAGAGATS